MCFCLVFDSSGEDESRFSSSSGQNPHLKTTASSLVERRCREVNSHQYLCCVSFLWAGWGGGTNFKTNVLLMLGHAGAVGESGVQRNLRLFHYSAATGKKRQEHGAERETGVTQTSQP